MTSNEIRQSFLDFFRSKQHTIVPSSSLMPDAPNLLFTNAGMNQFVPIFLGQRSADVDKWPGAIPSLATRAADTQKCIRAGGKHNDLEDVGLDTYHHTFFEMLGNWSFGDYFKKEAIEWAWELVTGIWKFPKHRLYATVYCPDKSKNDPAEFDQEAYDYWARLFEGAGLDPKVHIVNGGKKDNFWMMGDTGPCGPCSEIHVDLTPQGDTRGALVNKGSAECIEIWNLVFIQFNANPDGSFSPLPAKHVDTGMGFERVTGIIQNTKGFTDFSRIISNYETDVFRPLFDKIEQLSGKRYGSTLPAAGTTGSTEEEKIDVTFRVIADHIRTLSFAIADGIQPGNTDRNYVLRRILRRAVRYGRTLGFHEPFFYKLVDVLADHMGQVFPEIRARKQRVQETIRLEEEAFNKTLDTGIKLFDHCVRLVTALPDLTSVGPDVSDLHRRILAGADRLSSSAAELSRRIQQCVQQIDSELLFKILSPPELAGVLSSLKLVDLVDDLSSSSARDSTYRAACLDQLKQRLADIDIGLTSLCNWPDRIIPGKAAFLLYDTYGFPLDLTELMARERGLTVDTAGFEKLMEEQRDRARKAQKKEVIEISQVENETPSRFVGYDQLEVEGTILDIVSLKNKTAVILDNTAFYAEMGGQVGDTGELTSGGQLWRIVNTQKAGNTWLHFLETQDPRLKTQDLPAIGSTATLSVDRPRRAAIQRHHTVTHLFHWALHEVVTKDATQKGSYVGPEKLTFDFNSAPLTPQQVADIEKLVNERIVENAAVSWIERPYTEIKARKDILQFFGEKYGDVVRVVQIGGRAGELNGYSMELCGGTHTRATGEIGLFRIVAESAIAAGVRRIEAVAGTQAYELARRDMELLKTLAGKVNSPLGELEKKIEALMSHQKELEKQIKSAQQKEAVSLAKSLLAKAATSAASSTAAVPAVVENLGSADGDSLQTVADALKSQFKGAVVLGGVHEGAVALVATVSPEFTSRVQAGKIIQAIAPIVGGKGGGRPDNARGGGKEAARLDEALGKARELLGKA